MRSIQQEVEETFLKALKRQLEGHDSVRKITVAYSGGPDSTLLLCLLNKYRNQIGYDLDAAHVNHGIRSSSEMKDEDDCVRKNTQSMNILLHQKTLSPGFLDYYAERKHCGIESAARTYRYRFFNKILRVQPGRSLLALGHNRNDQEETIIMRLFSGSGIEGLKGIPESSETLIRPLINIGRDKILSYLEKQKLSFVHDSSNSKTIYLRNRIRLKLMSQIKDVFSEADQSILRLGSDLSSMLDHYNQLLDADCPWENEGSRFSCKVGDFLRMPEVSRRGVILRLMNILRQGKDDESRISRHFFLPLKKPAFPEGVLLKGHGIELIRKGDRLVLSQAAETGGSENRFFHLDTNHVFSVEKFSLKILPSGAILPPACEVLFFLEKDSVVVRTPLSKGEKRKFTEDMEENIYLVQRDMKDWYGLNSMGEPCGQKRSGQKRWEFDSNSSFQCVIIKGRGDYAPG